MEKEEGKIQENGEAVPQAEAEDVPVAPGQELNMIVLKELMTKVNTSWAEGHTNIVDFTNMYFEWTKLFRHFGNAVAIAFKGKLISIFSNLVSFQILPTKQTQ